MLRLLDTFSGIGGFSYAAERIVGGYETVAFVEREPFCQKVLRKHWPDVPIFDDITTYAPQRGSADVICGGFPCQDISTAGKQAGIKEGTGLVSFTNSCESFAWWDQGSSCWKTFQRSLLTGWTTFSESFPRQGLMLSGHVYRQVLWEPATNVIDGGLLPTPVARDWKGSGKDGQLPTVLTPVGSNTCLNPPFIEEMMGFPIGWTELNHSETQ